MIVSVKITSVVEGSRELHGVLVEAAIAADGSAEEPRKFRSGVLRIGPDGKDRAMTACLEEAFAEILKQALS